MCDAKIRPFRPVNNIELHCGSTKPAHRIHAAQLRDYSYKGSVTVIQWADADRRTFRGDWAPCPKHRLPSFEGEPACLLPANHHGDCAT